LKLFCQLYLCCFILTLVTACATPVARLKDDAALTLQSVRLSNLAAVFPAEVQDFYTAVNQGDLRLSKGDVPGADLYYSLALGKAEILEARYHQELKRREEVARLEFEMKRQAEAEIELHKKIEQERLAAEAREALQRKKNEEVKPVARHTVKRGETLPQIAALQQVYGESSLWPLIYKANRDQISNPSILWPGQVLRIPRNADKNDISEARRFAMDRLLR